MRAIETIFCIFAASSIFYAISLYLALAARSLEDKSSRPRLAKALHVLVFPFLILGLGGAAIFGPYELMNNYRRHGRGLESLQLVKFIAETNRIDKAHQESYWERNRFLYKTDASYDSWKRQALRKYGYYYDEVFHD